MLIVTSATLENGYCYQYRWSVASNAGLRGYFPSTNVIRVSLTARSLQSLPVGAIVQIKNDKFVKLNSAGLYMMLGTWP